MFSLRQPLFISFILVHRCIHRIRNTMSIWLLWSFQWRLVRNPHQQKSAPRIRWEILTFDRWTFHSRPFQLESSYIPCSNVLHSSLWWGLRSFGLAIGRSWSSYRRDLDASRSRSSGSPGSMWRYCRSSSILGPRIVGLAIQGFLAARAARRACQSAPCFLDFFQA